VVEVRETATTLSPKESLALAFCATKVYPDPQDVNFHKPLTLTTHRWRVRREGLTENENPSDCNVF
jgi:hypothetical protein